jgi:hypothetical protein
MCIDQAQRWSLWGYIPVVIGVPFQKTGDKILVLVQKNHGEWGLSQGRLQRSGLIASLNYMLAREVGLQPNDFKNSPFFGLGVIEFQHKKDPYTQFTIIGPEGKRPGVVSNLDPYTPFAFRSPRGKGYMYTLCACRLTEMESRLKAHRCYEIEEIKILPLEEVEPLLCQADSPKADFYKTIFASLRKV